ncbi:MAG: MBOAT family protein [Magnetococcus sp. DMHC-1]
MAVLWLGLVSLFFYGWWNASFVILLLFSIIANFYFAKILSSAVENKSKWKKTFLAGSISFNIVILCYFKYVNFFIDTLNSVTGWQIPFAHVILPLGISFFTFTQTAFLVDVYRGIAREYNFIYYLLFVVYFPHLIAGPVLHHKQVMPQFADRKIYRLQLENISTGMTIFTIGLAKKVFLADPLGSYVTPVFQAADRGFEPMLIASWCAAISFTLQLYFDFSGYSDMAIGISRLFGVDLPINFASPYKAVNIIEFWRRWHITLSNFLRDYLYIPLGGNRQGRMRRHINLMLTMLLGGLWHGASWNFVAWGGLHGLYLVINHAWHGVRERLGILPVVDPSGFSRVVATGLTFLAVVCAWVLFRADNLTSASVILQGMVGIHGITLPPGVAVVLNPLLSMLSSHHPTIQYDGAFAGVPGLRDFSGFLLLSGAACLVTFALPNTQEWMSLVERRCSRMNLTSGSSWSPNVFYAVLMGVVFFYVLIGLNKISQFLYYQF